MKKILLIGLAAILITACEKKTKQFTMSSSEIDEAKALINDYQKGDWESWATHYTDTAKIYHNTWKNGASAEETAKSLKAILSNLSSYHFEVDKDLPWYEMVTNDKGSTWVYFWGNWIGELAANNKKLEIPVHLAFKFADGKITREEGFYNLSEFTTAMQQIEEENAMPADEKAMMDKINIFVSEFLNKKDASVLPDILADNYVKTVSDEKVASGSQGLVENMNPLFAGFPDFKITLLHKSSFWENNVVLHWQLTGTNTGEFNGIPATGKKVKVTGMSHIGFNKEGKVAMEDVYYDNLSLMTQIGQTLSTPSK